MTDSGPSDCSRLDNAKPPLRSYVLQRRDLASTDSLPPIRGRLHVDHLGRRGRAATRYTQPKRPQHSRPHPTGQRRGLSESSLLTIRAGSSRGLQNAAAVDQLALIRFLGMSYTVAARPPDRKANVQLHGRQLPLLLELVIRDETGGLQLGRPFKPHRNLVR